MRKDDAFSSERLRYRGLRLEDATDIVRWRARPEVYRYFQHPHPITLATHTAWFQGKYRDDDTRFDFLVSLPDGTPIGTVGLSVIQDDTAEISYMIGEEAQQRQGYAREAIRAMMAHGAAQGIAHYAAVVHPENAASIRAVEALGFVRGETDAQGFLRMLWES